MFVLGINATVRDAAFAGAGFIGGAFTPALGRKIKAVWVKLTTKAESALETRVKALEAAIVKDGSVALTAATADVKTVEADVKKAV